MALYITVVDGWGHHSDRVWHYHQPLPIIVSPETIVSVQADGDELIHICNTFQGIPMTNRRVVTWTGEMANFIYQNL